MLNGSAKPAEDVKEEAGDAIVVPKPVISKRSGGGRAHLANVIAKANTSESAEAAGRKKGARKRKATEPQPEAPSQKKGRRGIVGPPLQGEDASIRLLPYTVRVKEERAGSVSGRKSRAKGNGKASENGMGCTTHEEQQAAPTPGLRRSARSRSRSAA
eukprot:Colp12_sorted_trinity150504_noHs@9329